MLLNESKITTSISHYTIHITLFPFLFSDLLILRTHSPLTSCSVVDTPHL